MQFTPSELELIQHRLEVPDAIAEAIGEDEADVDAACEKLERLLLVNRSLPVASLSRLETLVLLDTVTGSTWAACAYEEGAQKQGAAFRVGKGLAAKLSAALDVPVRFPTA